MEGLLAPPPSPTNIAVHHKHEQQAGSDGYASASWEGSQIPPSPPRRHDGSEIQGVEEGVEGIGMTWHGWDEMMARPRPRRTPHTSLCFPGRLWVDRCAAGLRYHGVAILEPRALSPPPSTAGRITAPLCRSGTELDSLSSVDWRTHQPMRYTSSTMRRRRRIDWQAQRTPHPRLAGGLMRSKRLELGGGPLRLTLTATRVLPRNRLDVFRSVVGWRGRHLANGRTGTTIADRPLFSSVKSVFVPAGVSADRRTRLASVQVAVSSTVQDHGPLWDRDGETGQSRLALSLSGRRKGKGTGGPWSRLVWSPTLNVLWKRACPRTERASERGSASIERSWIPCLLFPAGRHSARSLGGGENAHRKASRREEGKKDSPPSGPVLHTRAHGSPSLSLLERSLGLLLLLLLFGEGRAPGPGDTDTRQPANLAPRPKPCFFSASASILVSTLRCWAIPSGEESAVEDDQPEKKRWPVRDADARTYTHWHRGRLHVLRLRQTLTTERPEILLGDSAGQDITGQV